MNKPRRVLRSPFFSALLGGAIVAVFGAVAIAAGWIQSEGGSTTTVAAPLAAPVASKSSAGDANVVNQIYKSDGDGVAFIESQIPAQETQTFSPFGEPESEGGGTATGSGFVIDGEGHVLTNNHVIEGADRISVKLGASDKTYQAKVVGADPATDLALLEGRSAGRPAAPADAGPLLRDGSRRPGGRDRQSVRARPHRHQRHRLGAAAPDPGPQRLLDLQRDPDRRGDQPRQLGRAADQRRRRGDRHQLPDRDRRWRQRQRRHRLRDPDRHRPGRDPPARDQRRSRTRLHRHQRRHDHAGTGAGDQPPGRSRA